MVNKDTLIRLVTFGSPAAKAAALVLLNEKTDGELLTKIQEILKNVGSGRHEKKFSFKL